MGRANKPKPARLAKKLLQVRTALGLSQNEMIRRLGLPESIKQGSVSGYELGTRIPPPQILLRYAEVAKVWIDVLVDDDLDLPENIPSPSKSEGVRRSSKSRRKR
jgi:transcriptional regulator with XRE-family HTH domain